ncbi:MAG: hypothetical protein IPH23_10385 [Gammaproteobacteria bacterium]|nr:hypothetical protein [Gammaproteobacteria bacterium]
MLKKRREVARGAQRPRPIQSIGEGASTAQRSRWLAQQFFNKLLDERQANISFAQACITGLLLSRINHLHKLLG